MTLAEDISEYANSLSYKILPSKTIEIAKDAVIDTFGCALGAQKAVPVQIAKKTIKKSKEGASILCSSEKASSEDAGFVNGIMSRYLDYNDSFESKEFAHPSDNIMPLLAVAEEYNRTGKDVIVAIALAYEVQCRLSTAASLWKKGWDHTSYGLVSVATASSFLMESGVKKTTQAINIALNSHIAMRQVRAGELSMWKAISFPNAAKDAIFSAKLANNGITGPSPIFEGEMGFWKQVTGKFNLSTKTFGNKKNQFLINQRITKFYPAEIRSQSAITAAISAKEEIKNIDEIKKINILTTESGYKVLGKDKEKWSPKTKETADHSLPFIVCSALIYGDITPESYSEKRLTDNRINKLLKLTTVKEKKELTARYPSCISNEINVITKNKTIDKVVYYQKGHPKNPMSKKELEQKFITLASMSLSKNKSMILLNELRNLESIKKISCLFDLCM